MCVPASIMIVWTTIMASMKTIKYASNVLQVAKVVRVACGSELSEAHIKHIRVLGFVYIMLIKIFY